MKVSLICPIYNEKGSVSELIESMLTQSKKPDEIIFVDSFSTDGTVEIIKKYQDKNVVLIQKKSNISEARNIAIEAAKYEIIAATDASCKLDRDWLKNITKPFKDKNISVVSGGYEAVSEGGIEDYLAMLTVKPMEEWRDETFRPSSRSVAFRKTAWKSAGRYPEHLYTGEDTLFNLNLDRKGFKFKLSRDAVVQWRGRSTIRQFVKQFYLYGKGDGEAGNLIKIRHNLIFFLGLNFWIFFVIAGLIFHPLISLLLLIPFFIYFGFMGLKYTFRKRDAGCLFWIPTLLFLKRFAYFFGAWRGLLK